MPQAWQTHARQGDADDEAVAGAVEPEADRGFDVEALDHPGRD